MPPLSPGRDYGTLSVNNRGQKIGVIGEGGYQKCSVSKTEKLPVFDNIDNLTRFAQKLLAKKKKCHLYDHLKLKLKRKFSLSHIFFVVRIMEPNGSRKVIYNMRHDRSITITIPCKVDLSLVP